MQSTARPPARKVSSAAPASEELNRAHYDVLRVSEINREAHELARLADELQDRVLEFLNRFDAETHHREVEAAGLPPMDPDSHLADLGAHMIEDATALNWMLNTFVAGFTPLALPLPRKSR
jgi:hypothetical protein